MHTSSNVAAILLIIGAMSAADARADLVAFDFSGSLHNVSGYATNQDFGFEFSPITDLRVTTLLVWDSGGDDFGKTECFLLPVLDHCAREAAAGKGGIKALMLYPMNALANDQVIPF